jgi:hypothetical protein
MSDQNVQDSYSLIQLLHGTSPRSTYEDMQENAEMSAGAEAALALNPQELEDLAWRVYRLLLEELRLERERSVSSRRQW